MWVSLGIAFIVAVVVGAAYSFILVYVAEKIEIN